MQQRRYLAALCVGLLPWFARNAIAQPLTDLLPASTLVYAGWSPSPELNDTKPARLLADPRINNPWAMLLQEQLIPHAHGDAAARAEAVKGLVADLGRCEGCFALLSFKPDKQAFDTQAVLILNLGAGRADFEKHFTPLQEEIKKQSPAELKMLKVAGDWLWTEDVDKKQQFTWGFLGDRFIVYFGGGAEKFLTALIANEQPAPLKASASFTEAMNALPGPALLTTYIDAAAGLEMLRAALANADNRDLSDLTRDWAKTLGELGVGSAKSLVQKTTLADGQFVTRSLLHTDAAGRGLLALAAGKPVDDAALKCVPRDAILAASMRMDAGKVYQQVKSTAIALGGDDARQQIGDFEKSATDAGVPVADALATLGDQWVLYDSPADNAFFGTGWVLACEVKNAAKLRELGQGLKKLYHDSGAGDPDAHGDDVHTYDADGVSIHYVAASGFPISVAWALTGEKSDRLLVALYPQLIEDAVAQLKADSSILDNSSFTAMRKRVGNDGASLFVDMPSVTRNVYALLNAAGAVAGTELLNTDSWRLELLPPLQRMLRYVGAEGLCVRATDGGILVTQTSANPLLSPLSLAHLIPVGLPLALPSLSHAAVASSRQHSADNLTALGQVLIGLAEKENGKFPPDLSGISADVLSRELLKSPMGHAAKGPDIVYLPGLGPASGAETPIAYDAAALEQGDGTNILYADGHVAWSEGEEAKKVLKMGK